MSNKWTGLERRITAQDAEAEPERERLFSRPARTPSGATRELLQRVEVARDEHSERT